MDNRLADADTHVTDPTPAARSLAVVVPAVVVTIPLVGFSLQGDERRSIYHAVVQIGSNPFRVLGQAWSDAVSPAARDSLGPFGRILESLQHAFVFEAAEAAGLAPHVLQGVVRMTMVVIVAVAATALVSAVMRSAEADAVGDPVVALYPVVLGAVMVAGGADGPLTSSSFTSMGVVALVLGLSSMVARDSDMRVRAVRWHEPVMLALLGAAAMTIHNLAWVVMVIAAGLVMARAVAAGQTPRSLLATAAARRWASLCAGILVVLAVERAGSVRCGQFLCFEGSGLSASGEAVGLTAMRMLTGVPAAGWSHNAVVVDQAGLGFSVLDFVGNSFLVVLLGVIAVLTYSRGLLAVRHVAGSDRPVCSMRSAMGLGAIGVAIIVPTVLLAGFSDRFDVASPVVGEAGGDTLLVQVGWSFIFSAVVAATVVAISGRRARRAAVIVVAGLAGLVAVATLLANARLVHVDRHAPLAAVVSEISEFTIIFETGDVANALQCGLIDHYTRLGPGPTEWAGGRHLHDELNALMLSRQGRPFCDPTWLESKTQSESSPYQDTQQ